jgi:hypothetical protein
VEKGLFSGIVLLVIVVFLTPSIIFTDNSHIINNSYNHVTLLSLSADNIVVDGLLDETFNNSCAVATKNTYDSRINNYISSLLNETNKNSLDCEITLNSNLAGDNYTGTLVLTCDNFSKDIVSNIEKTIYFDKDIDASDVTDPVTGNVTGCQTSITDNLLSQEVVSQIR